MMELTQERLKSLLRYEPETGHFYWLVRSGSRAKVGNIAGNKESIGYIRIRINNRGYLAHRLAFLFMDGVYPSEQVDHVNGVRCDNRWSNLRAATQAQNCHNLHGPTKNNRSSRFLGVSWDIGMKKWRAGIRVDHKSIYLGCHDSEEDAYTAYLSAKRELHPYGEIAKEAA